MNNALLLSKMKALVNIDIKIKDAQKELEEWRKLRKKLRKEVKLPKWVCVRYVSLKKEVGSEWFTIQDAMKIWKTSYAGSEMFLWNFGKAGLIRYKRIQEDLRKTLLKLRV